MSERQAVTQPMIDAYVAWEPPCELDVSKPARALGLIRSAFMAGYKSGKRATPKGELLDEARGVLLYYADTFCEHPGNEGCGKFDELVCSGCKARAAIAKAGGAS